MLCIQAEADHCIVDIGMRRAGCYRAVLEAWPGCATARSSTFQGHFLLNMGGKSDQ